MEVGQHSGRGDSLVEGAGGQPPWKGGGWPRGSRKASLQDPALPLWVVLWNLAVLTHMFFTFYLKHFVPGTQHSSLAAGFHIPQVE